MKRRGLNNPLQKEDYHMNTRICKAMIVPLIALATMTGCIVRIVTPTPRPTDDLRPTVTPIRPGVPVPPGAAPILTVETPTETPKPLPTTPPGVLKLK